MALVTLDATRKAKYNCIQVQSSMTDAEFAQLRNFLGSAFYSWDSVNQVLLIGHEGKIRAVPTNYIVKLELNFWRNQTLISAANVDNVEVVTATQFAADFTEFAES